MAIYFKVMPQINIQYLDPNDPLKVSAASAAAGWVRYWDDTAKVPYLYNATENKFISYDDPQSIDLKVKYALSKQLGGVYDLGNYHKTLVILIKVF